MMQPWQYLAVLPRLHEAVNYRSCDQFEFTAYVFVYIDSAEIDPISCKQMIKDIAANYRLRIIMSVCLNKAKNSIR